MRFQVPQFIEVEDKIVGPLTFKQFVYIAGGAGLSFMLYRTLPFLIAIPFIGVVVGISAAFAFYKVNNKPFVDFVQAMMVYAMNSRLYIWKKEAKKKVIKKKEVPEAAVVVPKLSDSKLRELAWSLDIEHDETT